MKDALTEEKNRGISIVTVFDDLPKECTKIFKLRSSGAHSITYLSQLKRPNEHFRMDGLDSELARQSMKQISNIHLKVVSLAYALPKMITFLEMFGVGRIEHLNPLSRWHENNPVKSLAAPIGVTTEGSLFELDLHEKFQGPHGLVAGMTGSGKSEFIITYILSMAVNYHPDEVAFVLIDYKGGGLAGAFEDEARGIHLPHLVGTITNLDGAAISRSLMSIQSELTRRQTIFNKVKSDTGEGTLDIYGYQKLYRAGRVSEPLPHLFIISDEFAELKQQEPEFMDKLISAARIGRSLGVHLILATQKPSGVVNEQILSNTKFRVCLKVQDRMDSMDMLKRPEAAELKDTGRFYLQVGYNEFFALGQSAWCGAAYEPSDEVIVQQDNSVNMIDSFGQTLVSVKPKPKTRDSGMKQIVAIVKMLSDLAIQEHIRPRQLWQPPLPARMSLEDIFPDTGASGAAGPGSDQCSGDILPDAVDSSIQVLLGRIDDPARQSQYPMTVDLTHCQNILVVGDSGSGKTTLLQTMLYGLVTRYTPQDVMFYTMDFSRRLLNGFSRTPHAAASLDDEHEEAIDRCFKLLKDIIAQRKTLFADAQVNTFEDYLKIRKIPLLLVVIDNAGGLFGLKKGNIYYTNLSEYMRSGVSFGIKFILSVNHLNELSTKARQETGTRIALHLKDKFDYTDVLRCKCTYVPPETPGRGMCAIDGRPLEFHTALCINAQSATHMAAQLRQIFDARSAQLPAGDAAYKLPMIRDDENYDDFCHLFAPGRIPLGYSVKDVKPVALPVKQLYSLSLYFGNSVGIVPVLGNLIAAARREQMQLIVIKKAKKSWFDTPEWQNSPLNAKDTRYLGATPEDSVNFWHILANEIGARKVYRNEYCAQHDLAPEHPDTMKLAAGYIAQNTVPLLILFESFFDFCKNAHDSCTGIMPTIFQKSKGYNMYFAACFYPDDAQKLASDPMMENYNPEQTLLLFGGQFDRQGLDILPAQYQTISYISEKYNSGLMKYRGSIYSIVMPCGTLLPTEIDHDLDSIF